jgi:chromosomal replication initiator protein
MNTYILPGLRKLNNTDEVISMVCKNYQVSIDEIRSKSRKKEVSWPRQVICFLLYRMGNLSYKEIGFRVMRDHATVIHSVKVVEDRIAIYAPIKSEVMELLSLIKSKKLTHEYD